MPTLFDIQVKTDLQTKFENFDEENPAVWQLIVDFTMAAIRRGKTHYSMKKVYEDIRDACPIKTTDPSYKLNNSYTAFYARKFVNIYPLYKDFFELRKAKADNG